MLIVDYWGALVLICEGIATCLGQRARTGRVTGLPAAVRSVFETLQCGRE